MTYLGTDDIHLLGSVEPVLEEVTRVLLDRPGAVETSHLLERLDDSVALVLLLGQLSESLDELTGSEKNEGKSASPSRDLTSVVSNSPVDVADGVNLGGNKALLRAHLKRLILAHTLLDVLLVHLARVLDQVRRDAIPSVLDRLEVGRGRVRGASGTEDLRERVEVGGSSGKSDAGDGIGVRRDEGTTGLEREDRVVAAGLTLSAYAL